MGLFERLIAVFLKIPIGNPEKDCCDLISRCVFGSSDGRVLTRQSLTAILFIYFLFQSTDKRATAIKEKIS